MTYVHNVHLKTYVHLDIVNICPFGHYTVFINDHLKLIYNTVSNDLLCQMIIDCALNYITNNIQDNIKYALNLYIL